MKAFTFNNVSITVEGNTPEEAYTNLVALMAAKTVTDYLTDTYTDANGEEIDTAYINVVIE